MSKYNRRDLLLKALTTGVGIGVLAEQFGGVPFVGSKLDDFLINKAIGENIDSYQLIAEAMQGRGAFFGVHKAMAGLDEGAGNDWSLVQIKVCNHLYAPLIFALGQIEADGKITTGEKVRKASSAAGVAGTMLKAKGVEEISTISRFRNLRLNRWFSDILQNGTSDGKSPTSANTFGLDLSDVGPFPEDVALQSFIGLRQVDSINHSLKGCKLRKTLPDLTLFAQQSGLVNSPLGISCFMMGNTYDKAEGALDRNAVLGPGVGENLVVASRTVTEYVTQVSQFVGASYSDRESIEQNIVYRLDKLVAQDPKLRREMIASLQQFRTAVLKFRGSALLETRYQVSDPLQGNGQSSSTGATGATSEFLAQCKYVSQALDMPGTPLRNFSLFLNVVDLDGRDLNATINNPNADADNIRANSYIEGMRQLAMGLNLLAKKIAEGKKLIVSVSSEGGRSTSLVDSQVSSMLVMAPKRLGVLDDALYADMMAINQPNSPVVVDSAGDSGAGNWGIADAFKDISGTDAAA
ncbi:MAG: hypothetical protein NTV34_13720, partial [Proteobacteria bacterium]|nr:hypothetical protein [Pseudomonadota bacterium]